MYNNEGLGVVQANTARYCCICARYVHREALGFNAMLLGPFSKILHYSFLAVFFLESAQSLGFLLYGSV